MLKIIDNTDIELKNEAEHQLSESKIKYGKRYCPCALELTEDWICPCKNFREQQFEGECHCGRYKKINV